MPLTCDCGVTVSVRDSKPSIVLEFVVELVERHLHVAALVLDSLRRDVLVLAEFFNFADLDHLDGWWRISGWSFIQLNTLTISLSAQSIWSSLELFLGVIAGNK